MKLNLTATSCDNKLITLSTIYGRKSSFAYLRANYVYAACVTINQGISFTTLLAAAVSFAAPAAYREYAGNALGGCERSGEIISVESVFYSSAYTVSFIAYTVNGAMRGAVYDVELYRLLCDDA